VEVVKLLLIISILNLQIAPAFAEVTSAVVANSTGSPDDRQGRLTLDSLMYNSPQCSKATEQPDSADILATILLPVSTEIIAKTSTFILSQANMMRAKGLLQGTDLKSSDPAFQKMKTSCSRYPFQKAIMDKAGAALDGGSTPTSSGTPAAQDLQKRFLAAVIEANRITRLLSTQTSYHGNEEQELKDRLEKIKKIYPMAMIEFKEDDSRHMTDVMKASYTQGVGGDYDPVFSRRTHDNIDDYLFPDANGKYKAIPQQAGSPHSAVGFMNYLQRSGALPQEISAMLSKTLASGFQPVMEALGKVCGLDPCQTLKVNPSLLVEMLNQISEPGQSKTLNTLCLCNFGKEGKIIPELASTGAAVGAIGAVGACLLANVACGAAIVLGIVTSAYGTVNTYDNLSNLNSNRQLSSIANELPTTTAADRALFANYERNIYNSLAIDAATGVAGLGLTKVASVAMKTEAAQIAANKLKALFGKSEKPPLINAGGSGLVPAGHEVVSEFGQSARTAITKSVGPDGKISYSLVDKAGTVRPLGMDPSGYAIVGSDDFGRSIASLDMQAPGKSVIFVDVNHLGLVNYYNGGTAAGDAYLASVAKTISNSLGNRGTLYRWGGDEFVVVMNSTDPAVIKSTGEAIVAGVDTHQPIRDLFSASAPQAKATYDAVMAAKKFEQLSPDFIANLDGPEAAMARTNFTLFQERFSLKEMKAMYQRQAIQPSVSIGSTIVNNKSAQEAMAFAEDQAKKVKIAYKDALGLDTAKYRGRESYMPEDWLPPRDLTVKPVVLDPVQ
jgi:GGDEF domain-containing protein